VLAPDAIVDIGDNGQRKYGTDAEGSINNTEKSTLRIIEICDGPCQHNICPDMLLKKYLHVNQGATACKPFRIEPS
jgi:hypothetical protein